MSDKQHINIRVYGRVQGVYYRDSTKAVADQLSITGFIRNEEDGSVYLEAEGAPFMMEQFLEWCAEGPERANVERLEQEEAALQNFTNFVVRRS